MNIKNSFIIIQHKFHIMWHFKLRIFVTWYFPDHAQEFCALNVNLFKFIFWNEVNFLSLEFLYVEKKVLNGNPCIKEEEIEKFAMSHFLQYVLHELYVNYHHHHQKFLDFFHRNFLIKIHNEVPIKNNFQLNDKLIPSSFSSQSPPSSPLLLLLSSLLLYPQFIKFIFTPSLFSSIIQNDPYKHHEIAGINFACVKATTWDDNQLRFQQQ